MSLIEKNIKVQIVIRERDLTKNGTKEEKCFLSKGDSPGC